MSCRALELPADRSRPAVKQSLGADVRVTLPAAAWEGLKGQAQSMGASPYFALMAVLQIQLSRLGRTQRFVIGTPVAGRDQPELEPQIGFFVNLLPVVADVERGRTFAGHLSAVKSAVAAALSHATYPFDQLVTDLNLPGDMTRSPLFDVLMVFQGNQAGELSLGAVRLKDQIWQTQTAQFDLTFEFAEEKGGLHLRLEYDRALFEAGRIERMGRQFFALLQNAFATPEWPVEALEICYPCVLSPQPGNDAVEAVANVSSTLAALPDTGATHGLMLAYGPKDTMPEVGTRLGFNYLGEFTAPSGPALFQMAEKLPHGAISPDLQREHPVDVTAWIFDGQLHVQCAFVGDEVRAATMGRWLARRVGVLEKRVKLTGALTTVMPLTTDCTSPKLPGDLWGWLVCEIGRIGSLFARPMPPALAPFGNRPACSATWR